MAAFTNATLQAINQQIAIRNEIYHAFARKYETKSWDDVQRIVKTGHAADYFEIGEEFEVGYNFLNANNVIVPYRMPWVVTKFEDVYWENDPEPHPGMFLESKYATVESIAFDAPENTTVDTSTETTAVEGWYYWGLTGSTYTALNLDTGDTIPTSGYDSIRKCGINNLTVLQYGYNNYLYCAYRQWLNSAAEKGAWWVSKHLGDVAPSQLATYRGFMAGLDEDFLAVINPVRVQVASNTVTDGGETETMYDRFFLPSIEEMFGDPQAPGVEGAYFPYWKTKTGLSTRSNSANNGRIIYGLDNTSTAQNCRLRSANRGNATYAWGVYTTGQLNYNYAYGAYRAAPACVIS